jgi:Mitochondrial carrier protein
MSSAPMHKVSFANAHGLSLCDVRQPTRSPGHRTQARLQTSGALAGHGALRPTTWQAARLLVLQDGLSGLYRGFGAVALGAAPAQATYFWTYETGKSLVPARSGVLGDMATGCFAQLVAGLLFTPVDIVKERLQVRHYDAVPCRQSHILSRSLCSSLQACNARLLNRNKVDQVSARGTFGYVWNTVYACATGAEPLSRVGEPGKIIPIQAQPTCNPDNCCRIWRCWLIPWVLGHEQRVASMEHHLHRFV